MNPEYLAHKAETLLKEMVQIPAVSFRETQRSKFLVEWAQRFLEDEGIAKYVKIKKIKDNILLFSQGYSDKNLMLCAHIDTVPPAEGYTVPPYSLTVKGNRLTGLGTNDDGASVICMLMSFSAMVSKVKNIGLLLCLTTQEERGGKDGMEVVTSWLKRQKTITYPDFAIVGEPTGMRVAVAERGLLVLDGTARGKSCHAALADENNAIYTAIRDIEVIRRTRFSRKSAIMGPVHVALTQINAGTVHNVMPAECSFVADIRPNERYTNKEILDILTKRVSSTLKARSLHHNSRCTPENCLLMSAVTSLGMETYISPTTSDWAALDIPAIKTGPGESSRSHTPDEYITREEILGGIKGYINVIERTDSLAGQTKQ